MIDGWKTIATRLSALAGITISVDQARRFASRENDPLPVRRIGRMRRQRIIVSAGVLEEWARREFGE